MSLHQGFQEASQPAAGQPAAAAGGESAAGETFRWLDRADGHPLIQQVKQRLLDVCPVGAGDRVLDVGCGLGHEVFRFGTLVRPNGEVTGIDASPAMIAEARQRAAARDLPVTFEVGDAQQLPLPGGMFSLTRTERVLRYLARPEAALAEMVRVTRPGGSVLAFDFDSDFTMVDMPDPALVRRVAGVLDAAVPRPWVGRELYGMFQRAGLDDVRVVPHGLCVVGAEGFGIYQQLNRGTIDRAVQAGQLDAGDGAAWWAALERAAADGTFFAATIGFIAAGHKPRGWAAS